MANYRNISISFWTDSKVDDDFTPEDKYFYLYLLTNPHTNICGCYEISMKQMERETGYNSDTVKRLIVRMQDQHKVILYSKETKEILILNWCKYNWTDSEKVKKAIINVARYIKSEEFRRYVNNTVSLGYPYTMVTSVTDTDTDTVSDTGTVSETVLETETETENRYRNRYRNSLSAQDCASGCVEQPKTQKFIPPTVDEVRAYCDERHNGIDPEEFIAFYESKGWMIGRNKMKNWKSAIITWEKNRKQNGVNTNAAVENDHAPVKYDESGGYWDKNGDFWV